jgi:hypothetical protein
MILIDRESHRLVAGQTWIAASEAATFTRHGFDRRSGDDPVCAKGAADADAA